MAYYTGKRRSENRMIYLDESDFLFNIWSDDVYAYCKKHNISQAVFAMMCGSKSHGLPNSAKQNRSLNKEMFRQSCKIMKKDPHRYFGAAPDASSDNLINPVPVQANDIATTETLAQILSEMKEQTQVLKDVTEALKMIASAWS